MGWFDGDHEVSQANDTYNNVQPHEHEAKLSHELIAGAAAYEAAKAYEDHSARNGKPSSHAKAKEIFAGLAGVAVDRLVETKGLDFIDKQKAKRGAERYAEEQIASDY
ncbi:putative phosphoglycerate mutase family protein [Lactarius hengduanensis]|nr:putative phosphoglycerate mutase family protein [Lactarius hengduanensis]